MSRDPWAPFRHRTYAVIWTATVVSNIGTWMYSAAAAWLMTSLSPDPMMVSLVQAASNLPIFLFALAGGAIADAVDRRRFLIAGEIAYSLVAVVFALLVTWELVTPAILLVFAFLIGVGNALMSPPYQSIVPILVPREDLQSAVSANSVGMNISRAVGPALGGLVTAMVGMAAPFWVNALSNMGTIGALWWWQPPKAQKSPLPSERLFGAMRAGIRYALNNAPLRATFWRAIAFFPFASAYWALLPLVARTQVAGGADLYGILLGAIGVGAIAGAFVLPRIRHALGSDGLVAAGSVGTAVSLALFALAHNAATAIVASVIAGMSWIAVLSSLNVSAQVALPEWVRSRGLALYMTVFFGGMTAGSVAWGAVARAAGVPLALYLATAGILVAIPLTWRWKLQKGAGIDLTPSMHWPTPVVSAEVPEDAGPVMVTIEYKVDPGRRDAFLAALHHQAAERRRDGAYWWGVFEDVGHPGRFVETFHVESWLEHQRQHARVTRADKEVEKRVRRLVLEEPQVRHMIAAQPDESPKARRKARGA